MHNRQNNKETKSYVQGLRSFGNTLPRGVKGILKRNGYNYSEIISKWKMLVGKDISNYAYPKSIKMKNGNSNGVLILGVKRGNEINVEYSKKDIINKINSYFGYNLINQLKLETFNRDQIKNKNINISNKNNENFQKQIKEIKSKNIKDSLSKLLKAVKNDQIKSKFNFFF